MKKKLIEVAEAKSLILKESWMHETEEVSIQNAIGKFLAEPIFSEMNLPPFHSSAMDGFAIHLQETTEYNLVGEIAAGTCSMLELNSSNSACRIFTGAPVPDWADTVIMQEWANWDHQKVTFHQLPNRGANIRLKGSHVQKGQLLFQDQTYINGAVAATISGIGKATVKVYRSPKVTAIITGNEVIQPGEITNNGQIFDSNIPLLLDFGQKIGMEVTVESAKDNEKEIREKIVNAMESSDVILATGGVSVGDYDFIPEILKQLEFEIIFHGVAQKPGKPLLFAKKNNVYFWGLPGNPISVAHGLWMFVYDFFQRTTLTEVALPSATSFNRKPGLTQFFRAKTEKNSVSIIKNSDSHHIYSMSNANALVEIPAQQACIEIGDSVKTWILP
jgi:molybdopterin molybdotransferase